jgi:hypothetical protein
MTVHELQDIEAYSKLLSQHLAAMNKEVTNTQLTL